MALEMQNVFLKKKKKLLLLLSNCPQLDCRVLDLVFYKFVPLDLRLKKYSYAKSGRKTNVVPWSWRRPRLVAFLFRCCVLLSCREDKQIPCYWRLNVDGFESTTSRRGCKVRRTCTHRPHINAAGNLSVLWRSSRPRQTWFLDLKAIRNQFIL